MTEGDGKRTRHAERWALNAVIGGLLGFLVLLVFALTVVKMSRGHPMEGFDHAVRPSLLGESR